MDMAKLAAEMTDWGSGTINVRLSDGRWNVQAILSGERGMTTHNGSGSTLEEACEMADLPTIGMPGAVG